MYRMQSNTKHKRSTLGGPIFLHRVLKGRLNLLTVSGVAGDLGHFRSSGEPAGQTSEERGATVFPDLGLPRALGGLLRQGEVSRLKPLKGIGESEIPGSTMKHTHCDEIVRVFDAWGRDRNVVGGTGGRGSS